jgi:hypothetical protein
MKRWRYPCGCWFVVVVILTPKHETSPIWAAFLCEFSLSWSFSVSPEYVGFELRDHDFSDFLMTNFRHFAKTNFKNEIFCQKVLYFRWRQFAKFFTIAYNMKGCLRFYTFIFLILLNLAKFMYGLSLIEQHHEVEKNNHCLI